MKKQVRKRISNFVVLVLAMAMLIFANSMQITSIQSCAEESETHNVKSLEELLNSYESALSTFKETYGSETLEQVHTRSLFHRDLSPDNLFMKKDKTIKLIDFGNAKNLISDSDQKLSVVLKPGFAPPEQYSSTGNQGTYTDVYSLAATTYYLLTGVMFPPAPDRAGGEGYIPLVEMEVDPAISAIIDRAVDMNYHTRTQTMKEFGDSLRIAFNSWATKTGHKTYEEFYAEEDKKIESKPESKPDSNPEIGRDTPVTDGPGLLTPVKKAIPFLVVTDLNGKMLQYRLPVDRWVKLGRVNPPSEIVLGQAPQISKIHCEVYYDEKMEKFYIRDCSTNGLFINDARLQKNVNYQCNEGVNLTIANKQCYIKVVKHYG